MNPKLIANIVSQNNDILPEVYHAPRVAASASNEISVRIIEKKSKIVIHITAPDQNNLKCAVQEILGNDLNSNTFIEWCG